MIWIIIATIVTLLHCHHASNIIVSSKRYYNVDIATLLLLHQYLITYAIIIVIIYVNRWLGAGPSLQPGEHFEPPTVQIVYARSGPPMNSPALRTVVKISRQKTFLVISAFMIRGLGTEVAAEKAPFVVELDGSSWNSTLAQVPSSAYMIVEFFAPWCDFKSSTSIKRVWVSWYGLERMMQFVTRIIHVRWLHIVGFNHSPSHGCCCVFTWLTVLVVCGKIMRNTRIWRHAKISDL